MGPEPNFCYPAHRGSGIPGSPPIQTTAWTQCGEVAKEHHSLRLGLAELPKVTVLEVEGQGHGLWPLDVCVLGVLGVGDGPGEL